MGVTLAGAAAGGGGRSRPPGVHDGQGSRDTVRRDGAADEPGQRGRPGTLYLGQSREVLASSGQRRFAVGGRMRR